MITHSFCVYTLGVYGKYTVGFSLKMQQRHTPGALLQTQVHAQILVHALNAMVEALHAENSST